MHVATAPRRRSYAFARYRPTGQEQNSAMDGSYPGCSFHSSYQRLPEQSQHANAQWQPLTGPHPSLRTQETPAPTTNQPTTMRPPAAPKALTPRELRNRAEKQRRNNMSQSINRLASVLPPVVKAGKKVDKTSILRFTAHYLRSYRHVFGKSLQHTPTFSANFIRTVLQALKGFLLTTTYKGLMVVVSPNIQQYLGYTEVELNGQSLFSIVHKDDHQLLREQLYPRSCKLTCNGELLLSKDENAAKDAAEALMNETRAFLIRFKKATRHRSDPVQYLTCHVEGSFRKSDRAGVYVDREIARRVRARGKNPFASGNDVVFIGMVRPVIETFATERKIEAFTMEYRTRHSIDGGIMDCEQRIALVTGYMVHEVKGVNAMNFMHRDDVRYVIVALRQMYVKHYLTGESCYRLLTKNGEFIYMRTRGTLDVDPVSKEATSFVCTNTQVPEQEGIKLINIMKQKFSNGIADNESTNKNGFAKLKVNEKQSPSVEDPKQLEKVIYHLVTDLPSSQTDQNTSKVTNSDLAIIPPRKEQIKKAIEKSYSVIKTMRQLVPKTQLEKMKAEQSLQFSKTMENTQNGQNHAQWVADNPQQFNQNPSQNGYHPQGDYTSWKNIPFTPYYYITANPTEEEYRQSTCAINECMSNEAQATVLHGKLHEQAQYNNPNPDRFYGATTVTYGEENAFSFVIELAGNSYSDKPQNLTNNDEENLQFWSTQASADTNGMNALAHQFSEASNTLNGTSDLNGSNAWAEYNQEYSTEPQNHLDVSSTSDTQTYNNNENASLAENLDFNLTPTMQGIVESLLRDGDLFNTAAQASLSLMSDEPISAEIEDETKADKIYEIMRKLHPTEEMNANMNEAGALRQGPPVAAEESSVPTQQNNFYLEQPSQMNPSACFDPYEFNVDEPTGLTGGLSYLHAEEPPTSETETCKTYTMI